MVKNQPDETTAFWLGEQLEGKALRFRLSAFVSFIQQIFTEHLLCSGPSSGCLETPVYVYI